MKMNDYTQQLSPNHIVEQLKSWYREAISKNNSDHIRSHYVDLLNEVYDAVDNMRLIIKKDNQVEEDDKNDWICDYCGKSTFETDYDYLVSPKLHLECALHEELEKK